MKKKSHVGWDWDYTSNITSVVFQIVLSIHMCEFSENLTKQIFQSMLS